jgi:hypothetical protein
LSQALAGLFSRAVRRSAKAVVFVLLALVLVGMAGAAAPTMPRWLPVRSLSQTGADAVIPDVAVDENGNMVVVWAQAKGSVWTVDTADRPPGGPWSAPLALSAPAKNVAAPELALAGSHLAAVWDRYDGKHLIAQASERDPKTGAWEPAVALSSAQADAESPRIAVNPRGDAIAVWVSVDGSGWTVMAAWRRAGGSWAPPVALDTPQVGAAAPDVVLDGVGRAVVAWASTSGPGWRVRVTARGSDGTWAKATDISGPDATGSIAPKLALEKTGAVTAVWSRDLGTGVVIETATRPAATGVWSSITQLFSPGPDALAPVLAVDQRGDGVIVWTSSAPAGLSVSVSVRLPGKAWKAPVVLDTAKTGAVAPKVALDSRGDALLVWTRVTDGKSRVRAARLPAGSTVWSAPQTLSRPGADALTPRAALDGNGDGAVVWTRFDGKSFIVQGAGYDAGGPALNGLSIPASGLAGKKLVFAVAPKDVWTTVRTIRWSFGDGTAGSGRVVGHVYMRPGRYQATVTATDGFGHVASVRRWVSIASA